MVHAEAMRCKSLLKQTTFKTVSGHLLASIGSDKASYDKIAYLFDQNLKDYQDKKSQLKYSRAIEKLKIFEDEKAKKKLQQEEERLALEALESMKLTATDDGVSNNIKTTKKIETDDNLDEIKTEEDFLSDSDSDNDIEYFNAYKKTVTIPEASIATKKANSASSAPSAPPAHDRSPPTHPPAPKQLQPLLFLSLCLHVRI
jgi:hypothetical protein